MDTLGIALLCLGLCLGLARAAASDEKWWHNAIVYQVYPRSFMDSDGDGIGDLKGITSKLQHLADIGVTAVWLSPIYPSPQKDFGYDIKDFTNVDPQYGTMDDFDKLQKRAKELGLKVVLDFVPNHSSNEHDWFKKSESGTDSHFKDYYVWHPGNSTNWDYVNNRPGLPNNWLSEFRFSAWEWSSERKAYYLHQFLKEQPDLNYNNPDVVQAMKDAYTFWMQKGVDGFRVDAVPFLFEDAAMLDEPLSNDPRYNKDDPDYLSHIYTQNQDGTYDMVQQWRALIDAFDPNTDRLMMTECYSPPAKLIEYYGTPEKPGANFPFNFAIISYLSASSNATEFSSVIKSYMESLGDWRWPNWVIGNHDNNRVGSRYDANMVDALNMISLTLPGTAMTYYGEEIGMTDAFISWAQTKDPSAKSNGELNYLKTSRDPERTPMQWDDSVSAGFSSNRDTWLPTNPNYWELNVEAQKKSKTSHLQVYKDLAAARKTAVLKGKSNVKTDVHGENILRIERALEGSTPFITVVNVGSKVEDVSAIDLKVSDLFVYTASENSGLEKGAAAPSTVTLRPKAGVVFSSGAASLGVSAILCLALAVLAATLPTR